MVEILDHSELNDKLIQKIIEFKNLSWEHSYESHLEWLNTNLQRGDLHFFYLESSILVGYMNLVRIAVDIDNKPIPFWGIGNVCTKYKGKGDGLKLMQQVNKFLLSTSSKGILFCKKSLIPFYSKCNWIQIKNLHPNSDSNTFVFNYLPKEFYNLRFNDRLF
jgi:hypothetical protein